MTDAAAPDWYLFDYGMVLSTAPQPDDWARLQEATGVDQQPPTSAYWTNRVAFDAGELEPEQYWSQAAGRPLTDEQVAGLEALDAAQWAHLDPRTTAVLETLHGRGARLALLSNMPAAKSRRYEAEADWTRFFSHLFFSGRLRLAKPDPRVFRHVLDVLGARPERVLFVDDNATNVASARELGLRTVHHAPGTDLAEELAALDLSPGR